MDPIEKAIRTALEKGDAEDPEFPGRIYRSVEAALDRVIQANPQLTVEKAIERRRQLQRKIAQIETEFAPAQPGEDPGSLDASLDEALLDILERSPGDARSAAPNVPPQTSDAGRLDFAAEPVEPELPPSQTPQPVAPAVVSPAESHESNYEAPPVRPASMQPAPPAPAAPAVEPGGRREPVFSSEPASAPVGGRVDPAIGDGRFSGVARRAEADAPSPRTDWELGSAPAPSRRQPAEPTGDLGTVPERGSRSDDFDFPAIPPALDESDISAPIPESPPEIVAADRVARSRERRRPFAAIFLGAALLSLAAVGGMFAFQTGLLKTPEERDTSVPNPPPTLNSEDFDPATEEPPTLSDQPATPQNWLPVFSPEDPSTATTPGDTTAEPGQDDSGSFLRVRSGATGAAVSFDVERSVLEQLKGKSVIFSITARGEEGQQTEMSIECSFGELGDCGRKRYEVGYEKSELLFEITFPDKQPGANGTIAVNSDFSGQGRAIDIYEIRAAAR